MSNYRVHTGDVAAILPMLGTASFDAALCDPPYGLSFMGKAWDHGVPSADVWASVWRTLKPGAHLIAFGGTRTFHRLTCAIEDAGFEIRDCLAWLYGTGFPKSHNLKGDFQGYGTTLKPAWEPAILAMKPADGTFAVNALTHGVAGLNVDECRIGTSKDVPASPRRAAQGNSYGDLSKDPGTGGGWNPNIGRWPANVTLDEEAAAILDEQIGEASRFFYTTKASRGEREAGLEGFLIKDASVGDRRPSGSLSQRVHKDEGRPDTRARNHHPTVKPIALAEWLAKLLLPPARDTPRRLLVPFSGSGSEMIGALRAGWDEVVGIEREAEYVEIAEARLVHWMGISDDPGEAAVAE